MEYLMVGTPQDAQAETAAFGLALSVFRQKHPGDTRNFEQFNSEERLFVVRWTKAIKETPSGVRERGNCLRVRATFGHEYRIRYYECEVCSVRYYAEVIPKGSEAPSVVCRGTCSDSCREQHEAQNADSNQSL